MVGPAMESERPAPERGRRDPGDERVARRRPEALPDPVDHPEAHHLPRRARHRDQRTHQHRRGVADQDERPRQRGRSASRPLTTLSTAEVRSAAPSSSPSSAAPPPSVPVTKAGRSG